MSQWYILVGNFLFCFWIYLDFEIALFTCFVFGLISFFGSILFSVTNVLTFSAFGCSSFVINSCEPWLLFSSDSFQYCCWLFTDIDYFSCVKCSYHFGLTCMLFSCTQTYPSIADISSSVVINSCELWLLFSSDSYQCIAVDYLLMLTIFHVQNVLIILDWCLCDFLVLKHINELHALHLHWTFTDVNIFLCVKCSKISILLLIIYWCWLFFMCKRFLSFLIDVYMIFLCWNISMNGTHFISLVLY